MLVTPAATAYLLAWWRPSMMMLSALFGSLSSLIGLYDSYYANVASGAGETAAKGLELKELVEKFKLAPHGA